MKLDIEDRLVRVTLSKRNLLSLLTKLDMQGSHRTIFTLDNPHAVLVVTAETDEQHYGDREYPPGEMHPQTEADIAVSTMLEQETAEDNL